MNPSIAIIGGGVAGLGPAWQLAQRGWHVEIFERHQPGAGASTRAAGMLAPTSEVSFEEEDLLALGQHSLTLFPKLVADLERSTGVDLDLRRQGTLVVAVDRDDAEALEHLHHYHQRLELPVERLVGDAARKREPGLSPNIHYALYSPQDLQVDPVALVSALAQAAEKAGAIIHCDCPVDAIDVGEDNAVQGLRTAAGDVHEFSHILIAAGAWSPQIKGLPKGAMPHIRPVRGQMICVELGDPPLIEHVIRGPDAYLVPKSDGRLLIGATMEERGLDARMTAGGIYDILDGAWEVVPGIYDAPIIDMWTGFRPLTLANKPVIGPSTVDGLYLAVGHGRNGILLTAATAYGLAEYIDTASLPDDLIPFQLRGL